MACLRIVTWNANGLLHKMNELEVFLRTEKIDICLISESHLTKQSIVKKVYGYKIYHTTHPSNIARDGASVLIKDSIQHIEDTKIELEAMPVSTVRVQTKNMELNVSAIYCPPRHKLQESDYLNFLKTLNRNFIIGDFKAKDTYWGSRLITPKGKMLYNAGKKANCDFCSSGKPTYWPTDLKEVPDLIDFFVIRSV